MSAANWEQYVISAWSFLLTLFLQFEIHIKLNVESKLF